MQAILGACLLWAFFSTGASMICEHCLNLTGPCLESDPLPCDPDEDSCFDVVANMTIFGNFYANFKGCASSLACVSGIYSTTTEGNEGVQTRLSCCNTENCNNVTSLLPRDSNTLPNGLVCPGCNTLGSEECPTEEIIVCTGREIMCIDIAGTFDLTGTTFPVKSEGIVKGCTTPNTCQNLQEYLKDPDTDSAFVNITRLECFNALRAAKSIINGTLPNSVPLPGR